MCNHTDTVLVVHSSMWRDFFGDMGEAQYWICRECEAMVWGNSKPFGGYPNPGAFKIRVSEWRNRERINAISMLGQWPRNTLREER